MRHYWVLGLLGVGFYGIYQYSNEGLWFQHAEAKGHFSVDSQSGDFLWTGEIGSGRAIEVKGVNGSVNARWHRGDQVIVQASKNARRSDVRTVRFEVIEHANGVTICALYRSRGRDNKCAPGKGGRLGGNNNDVNVEFDVQVPSGVTFIGKTVNGNVQAIELRGPIEAETVNGEIKASASGYVSAESVNGDIEAALLGNVLTGAMSLQTVNGTVTLVLPSGTNADIIGATANGQIRSEFPLMIQGRFGPKRFEGVLGQGGEDIRLESVNGSISVIRRR